MLASPPAASQAESRAAAPPASGRPRASRPRATLEQPGLRVVTWGRAADGRFGSWAAPARAGGKPEAAPVAAAAVTVTRDCVNRSWRDHDLQAVAPAGPPAGRAGTSTWVTVTVSLSQTVTVSL